MGEHHERACRGRQMKSAGEAKRANLHLTRGQHACFARVGAGDDGGAHELVPLKRVKYASKRGASI